MNVSDPGRDHPFPATTACEIRNLDRDPHILRQHTREMAWSDWRDTDTACLSSRKRPAINHITSRPRLPAMSPCEINWTDSSHHGRGWLHPTKFARGDTTKSSS
ncbi:hypothetical protein F2Q69_00012073 [Brassica cretica]|uniref:Uncharacterized protein n=1 Tax=Brassica cretica TaxID=69181 RepID=A0A8S9QST5_BRACR|nr:hypothetical protein F2Q69_00012073 [Brassica cretica]